MQITITRTRKDDAMSFSVTVDGLEGSDSSLYRASQAICGYSDGDGAYGIFTENKASQLSFGGLSMLFEWPTPLDRNEDSLIEIRKIITERVRIVREWVNSIPRNESLSFEL